MICCCRPEINIQRSKIETQFFFFCYCCASKKRFPPSTSGRVPDVHQPRLGPQLFRCSWAAGRSIGRPESDCAASFLFSANSIRFPPFNWRILSPPHYRRHLLIDSIVFRVCCVLVLCWGPPAPSVDRSCRCGPFVRVFVIVTSRIKAVRRVRTS